MCGDHLESNKAIEATQVSWKLTNKEMRSLIMAKYGTQCMCDHGVRLKHTVWTVGVGGRYKMPNPQESLPRLRGFSIQGLRIKVR